MRLWLRTRRRVGVAAHRDSRHARCATSDRHVKSDRSERAREMMERTGESLSAIALSCGFSDQSHFTRAFRAVMGRSPAVWRRERRSGVTAAEIEGGAIA